MNTQPRNVRLNHRLDHDGRKRRPLERILLANQFVNRALAYTAQFTLTALLWPRFVAPFRWQLSRHAIPLAGLSPGFNGYRILQLSDLHAGKTQLSYLQRTVAQCRDEKPDLIVLTGDLIDYHPRSLAPLKTLLPQIVAGAGPDGVLAIFGNHDYHEYSWRHNGTRSARRIIHRRLVEIIQSAGITLLRNEQFRIRRNSSQLIIVGMDEMWTGRANPAAAFRGIDPADVVICLQHNPDGIEFLQDYPWQFLLCGHSHGGQALFPGIGALYVPMQHRQYLQGFFPFPPAPGQPPSVQRQMFVSRGLGYSTPIRLFCPPEATIFTLQSL
jgi:uncharacterized protein